MMDGHSFVNLLQQLTLPDNAIRSSAEKQFESMKHNNMSELMDSLLNSTTEISLEQSFRRLAAVLLRRILIDSDSSVFEIIPPESQVALKVKLLESLHKETDSYLRSRLCDIIGRLYAYDMEKDDWPELLAYTYNALQSQEIMVLDTGLNLVGYLSLSQASYFAQPENANALIAVYQRCFSYVLTRNPSNPAVDSSTSVTGASLYEEGNSLAIAVSAIRSLSSVLINITLETEVDAFYCLVPTIVSTLHTLMMQRVLVTTGVDSVIGGSPSGASSGVEVVGCCNTMLEHMIDISTECPSFFAFTLNNLFPPLIQIVEACLTRTVKTPAMITTVQHTVMELLVSVCAGSPKVTRKMRGPAGEKNYFALRVFPICVYMMKCVVDDVNWSTSEVLEEAMESFSDSDVGESVLDRLCQSLGLRSTFPLVSAQLLELLSSADWKDNYAALRYLGNYVDVTVQFTEKKQLAQHRSEVLSVVMRFAASNQYEDVHPRVRAAAFYVLNQFLIRHGKNMCNSSHNQSMLDVLQSSILPMLLSSTSRAVHPSPRIRREVFGCLISFIDCVPASMLDPIPQGNSNMQAQNPVEGILQCVTSALSEGPVIVQEYCVSVIVSLAETVREVSNNHNVFSQYYDVLMPILKQLLVYAHQNGLESLWGQSIECCAIVGEAAGKKKFYVDALEMMNTLQAMQAKVDEDESDARKYLLKSWVRIARCLGAEFLPFLHIVMEKLLSAITQDVCVVSSGGGDDEDDDEDEDIQMIETDNGWISVRSSAVEEQSSACQLLVLLIEKMQEHFYPYVEQTINALFPLLSSSPHEDVRSYCFIAMPELVRSTAKAVVPDRTALQTLSECVMGHLIKAVQTEGSLELIMTGLESIKQVLFYSSTNWEMFLEQSRKPRSSSLGAPNHSQNHHQQQLGSPELVKHKPVIFSSAAPAIPTPETAIPTLNIAQMNAITECAKIVLRDSLQRRALIRAEAQVSGVVDEDDEADEHLFMNESMELHFNVSELLGALFRTHGPIFTEQCYLPNWHEMIDSMCHSYCLKEDRQFSLYVVSDVIEFGLNDTIADLYFPQVLPQLVEICSTCADPSLRQTCVYAIGMAAEKLPSSFAPYASVALQAISTCISMGEDVSEAEPRGPCTDNAVSSVGIILGAMETLIVVESNKDPSQSPMDGQLLTLLKSLPYAYMWGQWIEYLPLRHDVEEGTKVLSKLCVLVRNRHAGLLEAPIDSNSSMPLSNAASPFLNTSGIRSTRGRLAITVLLQVLHTELCPASSSLSNDIIETIQLLGVGRDSLSSSDVKALSNMLAPDLAEKLQVAVVADLSQQSLSSSPLATAHIMDVLMHR